MLPLWSLSFATEALGGEREAGTLIWLLTRPLPRWSVYLAKYVALLPWGVGLNLVGFAVLGGVFGEGIDLVGDRLVGAVVVGVGLPQLCLERDLIREYFNQKNGLGFEFAYAYPGLNRVIQAAGRVIRSETDRGVVLLIDTRFAQAPYRELLPRWWTITPVRGSAEIAERATKFWSS